MLNMLKDDLKKAMIGRYKTKVDTIRIILGEIPRLNKKKDENVTKDEIINIIKKLVKSETQMLQYKNESPDDSEYIKILKFYLPEMMDEYEITKWIGENIDLSLYPSPIGAMGAIMRSLKGKADGNLVKQLLISF